MREKTCTYQIMIIYNRNTATRNLNGELTVWIDISLKDVSESDPASRRQIYMYIHKYF